MVARLPEQEPLVPPYIEVASDPRRDRPGVRGDDRIVGDAPVQFVGDDLRLHGLIATRPTLLHQLPPVFHPVLRLREESPVLLGLHLRQQRAKDAGAISNEADVSRISEPDSLRVDVDLHTFDAARLWIELDVGEAASDNQQRVAFLQRFLRGFCAEQANAADRERAVIGKRALSKKRLHNGRAKPLRHSLKLIARMDGPAPRENANLIALVQNFGCDLQMGLARHMRAFRHVARDVMGDVTRRAPIILDGERLHVRRDRDVRHPSIGQSGAASQFGHVFDVGRSHDARVIDADIHEELVQLHILLGIGVEQVVELQARDRHHGGAIELGVVKAIQQMDAPGTRCGEAAAEPARILGISAGHEGRRLFVSHLNEANGVGPFPQGLHDPVDPIAWNPENCIDTPGG